MSILCRTTERKSEQRIVHVRISTNTAHRTEMGQLMTSQRDPKTDKYWNYVRPLEKVKPYLWFDEITPGIFELVVLDGLPTKTISNSDEPPNSYRTRDTFVKHPTIADAWKYLGRLDDRVTLFNGEKVLPVPYEHRVRQSELVQDCLVFGVGKAFPGLLIMPSEHAAATPAEELLDQLWPIIDDANEKGEQFGRISREMVAILPAGTAYPRTDKGTVIRAACYQHFNDLIESVYEKFETSADGGERLALEGSELQDYLKNLFTERVGVQILDNETDFFAAGIDSLQAINARSHLVRELDLGGNVLGQNVVFDYPNITRLTEYLVSLRTGSTIVEKKEEEIMEELVAKYGKFEPFQAGTSVPEGEVVVSNHSYGQAKQTPANKMITAPYRSNRFTGSTHSLATSFPPAHYPCVLPCKG